jgi:putative tryptophan/tyrosine transport system substrate-binding protein
MRRRDFIALVGGAAATWSHPVQSQQPSMPVIGFLSSASPDSYAYVVSAFRQGLSETGHVEGRNVAIEFRWADGQNDRLPALAADLVRRQVSVIAAPGSTPAALAAKAATATIPIVFEVGIDPVAVGLVTSLARPGGNVTGVTNINIVLAPKRLELLRELIPAANVIALLVNPTSPHITKIVSRDLEATARTLGLQLHILHASTDGDFDTVSATLVQLRVGALVIAPDLFFITRNEQLATLTIRHAVPAITQYREFATAGGLMSYGGSITEAARHVGVYTGRVLNGEKPADLPVLQAAKIELIINLKTAKAIGLSVPNTLLRRADEVIE